MLEFATYSNKELGVIDLDNTEYEDLTELNLSRKRTREELTKSFQLPEAVFIKNRTISKDNQERLLQKLMDDRIYRIFQPLITHTVDVENFLKYRWITKLINVFHSAGLIDEITKKKYSAVANNYYEKGFKGILGYEIGQYQKGKIKTVDKAYNEAFNCLRGILEHKIPKMLSLFDSIISYVAGQKGDDTSAFTLSRVRRYYETGVKSLIGEALIEYGFPTDAVRRIEEKHSTLCHLEVNAAKDYCGSHYKAIAALLDSYEVKLLSKALKTL